MNKTKINLTTLRMKKNRPSRYFLINESFIHSLVLLNTVYGKNTAAVFDDDRYERSLTILLSKGNEQLIKQNG